MACNLLLKNFKKPTAQKKPQSLLISAELWKTKWRYYRDEYIRKKRALKPKSGQAAVKIKKWAYMDILGFLDKYTEAE